MEGFVMQYRDTFLMAIHNLNLNKKRSMLAMLGIAIGVMGVVVMGIVGSSGKKIIFEEIKTFGLQTVWIYRDFGRMIPGQDIISGTGIKIKDCTELSNQAKWIRSISPVIEKLFWVSQQQRMAKAQILYVAPAYFEIENDTLITGRTINSSDINLSKKVCVIGQDIAIRLFGNSKVIGKTIDLMSTPYEIVGILANKDRDILKSIGVGNGQNPNGRVIIPISVLLNEQDNQDVDYIQLAATSTDASDLAAQTVLQILKRNHIGQFTYTYTAMKNYIQSFSKISRIFSIVLIVAVTISLVIGGIGIANVMTIAVIERTKEIGIRKAIGATQKSIFLLFLTESILLTSCAGLIGIVLGSSIGALGYLFLPKTFVFPIGYLLLAFGVAVATGIISGVIPAITAAKKQPVEALRYE